MILLYSNMHTLLHGPSVCVFMYGQATESRWVHVLNDGFSFSESNQNGFFSWELLTIRDVQFRTSYLCSYQCSPQVPTRPSWRLPKQTPSSLCHASPSCSMAICGREKNHWSQCIKGHIFFPPSVQRHAKRYGEEGFSFISAVSYEKNYMKIFWGGLKPPHCKSTC